MRNFCRASCFIALVASTLLSYTTYAQRADIEALKNKLGSLNGSERIDGLNTLSLAYTYLHVDSAKIYAKKAYQGAVAINYSKGMVMALNNDAHIAGLALHNFPLQEKISLHTLESYRNLIDNRVLAETYLNLAISLFCQGNFERSLEACNQIILFAEKTSDKTKLGEAIAIMGCISLETGNYEKSFERFNQSLVIFKQVNDSFNTAILLTKIGDLYQLAGDQKTALSFYYESLAYPKGSSLLWRPLVDLGDTYYFPEQYDSVMFEKEKFMQTIKSLTIRTDYNSFSRVREAELNIASKNYNKALYQLHEDLTTLEKTNDQNQLMRVLLNIAKAYQGKNDNAKAFYFTRKLLQNARLYKAKQYLREGYELMYKLYNRLNRSDSAYYYFRQYTYMKDSVSMEGFSKKLAIYKAATDIEKKQAQIERLNNEKLISSQQLLLGTQKLKAEKVKKNILIGSVLMLILMGLFVFRFVLLRQKNDLHRHEIEKNELKLQKLESEKVKIALQQQATELEMQALRAQMNPHFIFNSLNSINRFILQNDKLQASEYLTKFSRLVRLILQNSQSTLIPLESELEALQVYLELEVVRFEQHFEFVIQVDPDIEVSALKVPPLIIQPYAENAIWHGLMHKEEKGLLVINLSGNNDTLYCKITDDGIGRNKARELRSKSASTHKSMGMQITANRISMLQKNGSENSAITITDLVLPDGVACGTEVLLKIPFCYD